MHVRRRCRARGVVLSTAVGAALPALGAAPPTDVEQYAVELINRARLDPVREVYRLRGEFWGNAGAPRIPDLLEGASSFIFFGAKDPLAINADLTQSARDYAGALLLNNAFTSTLGGTSPTSRAAANGFTGVTAFGENLAVSTSAGGAWPISQAVADLHQVQTYVDANHVGRTNRINLLTTTYKEVGVGFGQRNGYVTPGQNAVMSVYDFGASSNSAGQFLTGVAFSDGVLDNESYDVGEGLGGITVSAVPAPGGGGGVAASTTTTASGGYSLGLAAGVYDVTFSGAGLASPVVYHKVRVQGANVKVDVGSDHGVWAVNGGADWGGAANWSGGLPVGAGKTAVFGGRVEGFPTIGVPTDTTVGQVVITALFPHVIGATSGGALVMQSAGTHAARIDATFSHTIAAPLKLERDLEVAVGTMFERLTLSGPITGAGKGLTKFGRGSLRLAGDNAGLTGGVNVVYGPVIASHSRAFGTGPVTIGFGSSVASLELDTAGVNIANPITFPGANDLQINVTHAGGESTLSGPVAVYSPIRINVNAGNTLRIAGAISDAAGSPGGGGFQKNGPGTLVLDAPSNSFSSILNVTAGTLVLNGSASNTSTLFLSGGVTRLGADQSVKSLSIFKPDATLDLNGRVLTIRDNPFFWLAAVRDAVGTSAGSGGIVDSTGNAARAIGYVGVGNTHVVVRQTLAGDADLDLAVDFEDLVRLAQNYNTTTGDRFWGDGDFTYDGNVDFNDLVKLAQNYNAALPAGPVPGAAAGFEGDLARAFAAAVPEPGFSLAVFGACGVLLGRRRRRRAARPVRTTHVSDGAAAAALGMRGGLTPLPPGVV